MSLPPLLSRWQQLSLSILDELHEANLMFNIKWNKVIRYKFMRFTVLFCCYMSQALPEICISCMHGHLQICEFI